MEPEMESEALDEISWIFSAEVLEHKTPSREDGISSATERRYRREGARFIMNASNTLKLRRDTIATGAVFFHRFFMVQSFKDFDRWVVASTCILLAGKVEETPKQCKNVVKVVQQVLTPEQMKGFGNDPKEELFSHERVLLQTIRFDLQVHHPYDYLLKFAQSLKGEKAKIEQVLQMAWTFINDSLCTTLCLQWEPPAIAVAMLYLSGKLSKFDLQTAAQGTSKRSWWRQFVGTVDVHDLESICHQVLDVYSEEEKSANQESNSQAEQSQPPRSSKSTSPVPPPPPPPTHTTSQLGHPQYLTSTTHLSYTTQTLQQAMGGGHAPSTIMQQHQATTGIGSSQPVMAAVPPPTLPLPQQQGGAVGSTLGTVPTIPAMGAYRSIVNQSGSTYSPSVGITPTGHYQTTLQQMQHPGSTGVGVSHLGQMGGVNSRYGTNSGVPPPPIPSSFPSRQQSSLYPPPNVPPLPGPSGAISHHSHQQHPSHHHHHQSTYRTHQSASHTSGNWTSR